MNTTFILKSVRRKIKSKWGSNFKYNALMLGKKTIFKKKTQQKKMDIINTWKREGEVKSHGRKRC